MPLQMQHHVYFPTKTKPSLKFFLLLSYASWYDRALVPLDSQLHEKDIRISTQRFEADSIYEVQLTMMSSGILALWGKCLKRQTPQDKLRLSSVKSRNQRIHVVVRLTYCIQPA
jgi:hypothetical protein